ncbi:hypothetical protein IT575_09875 [bacterium]|nr:hypothetical protein [bacterium]
MENNIQLLLLCALPMAAALACYLLAWLAPATARRFNGPLGAAALAGSSLLGAMLWLPLAGANVAASFSRPWVKLPDTTTLLMSGGQELFLSIPFALRLDLPGLLFAITTAGIGLAVLLYALRERRDDERRGLFFAHLTLFSAAMLMLLCCDTLLLIYIAWELMGLCSYLLIAHRATPLARRSARLAFWTTRATDFALLIGIIILMANFNVTALSGLNIAGFYQRAVELGVSHAPLEAWFGTVGILLVIAAIGKSGQFPLCFWLSGAMVAPTPVSAMLHAATMVAAGPYLLYRMSGLFFSGNGALWGGSEAAMLTACLVGAVSLILCGVMALCADDAKRVLAYSTASQLGLAILAVGALSEGAAIWQLTAHAWAKAALFLGAGLLAASLPGHSTSLKALAGSARQPLLRLALVLAALSLAGLPLLPGGQAKDSILHALWTRALVQLDPATGTSLGASFPLAQAGWTVSAVLLLLSVPLTAAYLIRLVGILGWGKPVPAAAAVAVSGDAAVEAAEHSTGAAAPSPGLTQGWGLAKGLVIALSLFGTIALALLFGPGRLSTRLPLIERPWAWAGEGSPTAWLTAAASLVFILGGAYFAWRFNVARPDEGARLLRDGNLKRTVAYFRNGMLLRQFWEKLAGRGGWLLAQTWSLSDRRVVDALVAGALSKLGNGFSEGSRIFDKRVVDGARWAFCEFWWWLRRLHQRLLQTGYVQHYMFIILLGAVVLCFVVLRPLGDTFKSILGRR